MSACREIAIGSLVAVVFPGWALIVGGIVVFAITVWGESGHWWPISAFWYLGMALGVPFIFDGVTTMSSGRIRVVDAPVASPV